MKIVFVLLFVSVLAGLAIGELDLELERETRIEIEQHSENVTSSVRDIYGGFYRTVMDARDYRTDKYDARILKTGYNGDLERIYRSNINVTTSSHGTPPVRVMTNSRGLREQNFRNETPENTTRILVIGDSYVYGSGVNRSDRYTDILESKLNRDSEKNYQVINAGIFGAGVKDYYLFLKHRGLDYEPEIVVVGVIGNDWMPLELEKNLSASAERFVDRNQPDVSESRRGELISEKFLELQGKNQDLERYSTLRNLSSLAARNDIETVVFASDYMADVKMDKVERYGRNENSTLVKAPKEFRDDWQSDFCLKYSPNRVSTLDPHPSPQGHEMLAETLYREIKGEKEPLVPWHSGGFIQWIDPC